MFVKENAKSDMLSVKLFKHSKAVCIDLAVNSGQFKPFFVKIPITATLVTTKS